MWEYRAKPRYCLFCHFAAKRRNLLRRIQQKRPRFRGLLSICHPERSEGSALRFYLLVVSPVPGGTGLLYVPSSLRWLLTSFCVSEGAWTVCWMRFFSSPFLRFTFFFFAVSPFKPREADCTSRLLTSSSCGASGMAAAFSRAKAALRSTLAC